jgi:Neutral/alkaline non-lysosomal ceramidase.
MIECGMSEINITPPLGCDIPGYLHRRKATGVKDELYAKSIVMDNGMDAIALIVIDALCIESKYVTEIRERVSDLTGIPQSNIMVSATHAHTGGPIINVYGSEADEGYLSYLVKKAADAAAIAFMNKKPVRIGYGAGMEKDIAFNRRFIMKGGGVQTNPGIKNPLIDRPAGPIDPELTVMRIDDMEGNPLGIITNYTCHLDVVSGTEYSADYPGELSRSLKKILGPEVVSIFLTGACGNINHVDVNVNVELSSGHYEKMGKILAGEVLKVREKINFFHSNIALGSRRAFITIHRRQPSRLDIQKADDILEVTPENETEVFFANEILKVKEDVEKAKEVEVQVIKIGELSIVGLPGEIFVEFGLDIKKRSISPYNMINTLANGINGYIAIREAFEQGGYEPRLTTYTYLEPEAGYKMVSNAVNLITEL